MKTPKTYRLFLVQEEEIDCETYHTPFRSWRILRKTYLTDGKIQIFCELEEPEPFLEVPYVR